MSPKLKSLLYLFCFIFLAIVYYYIEHNEKKDSIIKSENFATMEMIDMNDSENLNFDEEVQNKK